MVILNTLSDSRLGDFLQQGSVGVIPTDTVYGLVCQAASQSAVDRLYQLKSRDNKPGTIIAANIQQIIDLGISARYLKAVEQFWPNPISVVVASAPGLAYLDKSLMSLAVRIPKDKELVDLLQKTRALLTTSANQPGEPPANTIQEAQKYFGNSVDFYVDGGDLSGHQPSTVIRVIDDAIEIIREGAVKINEKGEILS